MKYLIPVLLVITLFSCGTLNQSGWKLVKVDSKPKELAKTNAGMPFEVEDKIPVVLEKKEPATHIEASSEIASLVESEKSTQIKQSILSTKKSLKKKPDNGEGEDEENPETQEKVDAALAAEKIGNRSLIFGVINLVTLILPFIPFLGLIMSILAITNARKALRERFITEKGLKSAQTGLILGYIGLGLRILSLVLFIILLLVLLGF